MKVVKFGYLARKKRIKQHPIVCLENVFFKMFSFMFSIIFLFTLNIISGDFFNTVQYCISNFISSFGITL